MRPKLTTRWLTSTLMLATMMLLCLPALRAKEIKPQTNTTPLDLIELLDEMEEIDIESLDAALSTLERNSSKVKVHEIKTNEIKRNQANIYPQEVKK